MLISLASQAQSVKYGQRLKIAQSLAKVDDSTAAKIIGLSTKQFTAMVDDKLTFPTRDQMEAAIYALKRKRKGVNTF